MGRVPNRNRDIVIKTQFNIHGSRGKDVGHFIRDYVTRASATDASMGYLPSPDKPMVTGDGVAFTLDATAISRDETLWIADHVQEIFERRNRAIEQMVISFAPDYLVRQAIVPADASILSRGDYTYGYDDVRLRHAVSAGVHAMLENDGYYNGAMVAAIQSDTLHLHVHAVVYEDGYTYTRKRGKEERGMLKDSSLRRLSHHIDRHLSETRDVSVIPTRRTLTPFLLSETERVSARLPEEAAPVYDDFYFRLYLELKEKERLEEVKQKQLDALQQSMEEGGLSL